jgi:hypothetical protein
VPTGPLAVVQQPLQPATDFLAVGLGGGRAQHIRQDVSR